MLTEHDPRCVDGWVDLAGGVHPIACRRCRPDLAKCLGCGTLWTECETGQWIKQRRCCGDGCTHTHTYLDRRQDQTP